jgi:uncharacterized protein DUF4360
MHQRWIKPATAALSSSLFLFSGLTPLACADVPLTLLERQVFASAEPGVLAHREAPSAWIPIFLPTSRLTDAAPPAEDAAPDAAPLGAASAEAPQAERAPATDAAASDRSSARVRIVAASGSGCAEQTASVGRAPTPDASSFSVRFSGYTAAQGPDAHLARAHCAFAIAIEPPSGMTYAVTQVHLGGKVELHERAMARATVQYFYQGVPRIASLDKIIKPSSEGWQTPGAFAPDDVQLAPCGGGGLLFLDTSMVVMGELDAATSRVSVDPELTVRLALAACE